MWQDLSGLKYESIIQFGLKVYLFIVNSFRLDLATYYFKVKIIYKKTLVILNKVSLF